jgi:two-component system sensor histidine kinase UhpB
MGLVFRINLVITVLLIVLLGGALYQVVQRVRSAVLDEVSTATEESLELISSVVTDDTISDATKRKLIVGLSSIADTEQVIVEHRMPDNQFVFRALAVDAPKQYAAPDWFMRLMTPNNSPQYAHEIPRSRQGRVQVLINPADRIDTFWREVSPLLYFLAGFALLSYALVYLCVRVALRPVTSILTGLDRLADGEFSTRLPIAGLPELRSVAHRVNSLADKLQRADANENHLRLSAINAQELERRHLAAELHDEFGQSLTAIKALTISGWGAAGDSGSSILKLCDHLHDVLRGMMRRLRPAVLDEFGLTSALQHMVDDWNEIDDAVFCSLSVQGNFSACDEAVTLALYRMIQECLTNTRKYATASQVEVRVSHVAANQQISLQYRDDGAGFDLSATTGGYGLRGLRDRVRALNGTLHIASAPGRGFSLDGILPAHAP